MRPTTHANSRNILGTINGTTASITTAKKCQLTPPAGFCPPKPRPLIVTDGNYLSFITANLGAVARLTNGIFAIGYAPFKQTKGPWPGTLNIVREGSKLLHKCKQPRKMLVLYENEANPDSRFVREALSMLDISVEYRPSFENSVLPKLVDESNQRELSGNSQEIISYLFETYGPGKQYMPWSLNGRIAIYGAKLASLLRNNAGSEKFINLRKDISFDNLEPIELWGFEGSPFTRPVREALSSLGLRHRYIPCARGSNNRDELYKKTGHFQVPYLEDPNTGVKMFESGEIVKYLLATYTTTEIQSQGKGKSDSNSGSSDKGPLMA